MRRFSFFVPVAALLLSGCVYYNTFFLAKKNFKEAESDRKRSGLEIVRTSAKYQKAIEKASRVLEFDPDSKYVDDALYLIGRSFYHQGEFARAETKFRELLAGYPNSRFAHEALFYLGKSRFWREDYLGAREAFERVDSIAGDRELRSESLYMLGELLYAQKEWDRSISVFSNYLDLYRKAQKSGAAGFRIGEAYYSRGDYQSAKDAYLGVQNLRADDTLRYQARYRAGDCYYLADQPDSGLMIFRMLAKDQRNYDKMADIHLEIARGEGLLGNNEAAMAIYDKVIEEFPRTEQAAVAYYHLGIIHQEVYYDLEAAKAMYDSSTVVRSTSPVGKLARSKSADIAKLETYRSGKSAEKMEEAVESQYLLAELYLVQLDQPDSALSEYQTLIDSFPDSKYAPPALFAIGWIMENMRGDTASAIDSYRRLIDDYPGSDLAVYAMERLGIDPDTTDYDYPARRYHEAERLLFSEGNYAAANELFSSIVDDFPESEYAPKASLAIAWALSSYHPIPAPEYPDSGDVVIDSTYIYAYERVSRRYPGTEYGKLAQTLLKGQGVTRQRSAEPPKETLQDTEPIRGGEPIDSSAILDSIAAAIKDEVAKLERAPERPTEQKAFEQPASAYSIPVEERLVVQFKVRINFVGEVTEYQILRGSGYEDIDRAAVEVVRESIFDATRIEPQFYDSWFYYEYFVPRRNE